mmetsp:Transcript_33968/g.59422  ORF Transcript_33968/g.59422 Transcript_33968/m.59422 type:complete len:106 (-) Transcript_33968:71-388(-)
MIRSTIATGVFLRSAPSSTRNNTRSSETRVGDLQMIYDLTRLLTRVVCMHTSHYRYCDISRSSSVRTGRHVDKRNALSPLLFVGCALLIVLALLAVTLVAVGCRQ